MIFILHHSVVRHALTITAGVVLALFLLVHPGEAASKPRPPVTVTVVPAGGADAVRHQPPADPRDLEVVILSSTDVPEATATIECADGAVLVGGLSAWHGPLSGRIEQRIPITVRPSPSGKGRVRVTVVIAGPAGPAFTTRTAYSFTTLEGGRKRTAPAEEKERKAVRKDRSGRDVVEHPVR